MISDEEMRKEVREIIVDILELDDGSKLTEATTASDVKGWDSLHHVRIMLALERKFGFQWDDEEVTDLKNVGDLYTAIHGKISAKT
ncbi:MAG TPA: acyl carrier protein [Rhizomicrobium sp.]|jgi:acyl carrier protein